MLALFRSSHTLARALVLPRLVFPATLLFITLSPHPGNVFADETLSDSGNESDPHSVAFFESRIRPVLIKHCYECHSQQADEIGGTLMLDSADAMRQGGDSGPAVVPGQMQSSVLISAIRYESSEMPPSGKLPGHIIEDFEQWVRAGAVDPREPTGQPVTNPRAGGVDLERGREFWAFQPLQKHEPPVDAWGATSIDRFLNAALSQAGITPQGIADPATRLRRLVFDLTGLPPSLSLQERWLADPSSSNWQRIVDEQLASTEFAEHWARHWMDVARYADSNGSDFNATFHDAWRYRDYLIDSFASDRPIDEMIQQQIAGDLITAESDQQRYDNLVATTFLMLGTKMLSERNKSKLTMDVVDEQIDTVGRAFLGLTLGCARCHDHKFDPVGMQDYYALAGIFKSTQSLKGESQKYVSTWKPTPLPASDDLLQAHRRHEQRSKDLERQLKDVKQQLKSLQRDDPQLQGIVLDDESATQSGDWQHSTYVRGFIGKGYLHDENRDKGKLSLRFAADLPIAAESQTWECRLWYTSGSSRADHVPVRVTVGDQVTDTFVDQSQGKSEARYASLGRFEIVGQASTAGESAAIQVTAEISNRGTSGYVTVDAVQWIAVADEKSDTGANGAMLTAAEKSKQQAKAAKLDALTNQIKTLEQTLKEHKQAKPARLPHAMAVRDLPSDQISDCPIHIRGEVNNLGDTVPRGFLRVCGAGNTQLTTTTGSGRAELAAWLTDPDHPLTARVFVNRVWLWLVGEGIVRTVDNFGQRGERPSHPELLDTLAVDFIRGGWQVKPLIRQIVCSDFYQRSSSNSDQAAAIDVENRLLWRAHRKRLPAEAIRDAMLSMAGRLDRTGRVDQMDSYGVLVSTNNANAGFKESVGIANPKRSIYMPVIRSQVPPLLATLDAADPDLLVGRRPTTNVPAQALTLIGSEAVQAWAKQTAERMSRVFPSENDRDLESQAEWLYRLVLQRAPSVTDHAIVNDYWNSLEGGATMSEIDGWQPFIAAMFASTEFRVIE